MKRILYTLTCLTILCAAASAQTSTTLSVTASIASLTSSTITGTATLSGIGSGTFSANVTIGTSIAANYTITLSGGTITGVITAPITLLAGQPVTGSGTITGGTGSYAGATGSFPSLNGTGAANASGGFTLTFTGAGTISTGGGPTTPTPRITAVLDAASYTNNISRGSIFVVKGSNLSASGFTQLSFPLPTSSSGVRITFTPAGGGAAVDAYLVYLYNQSGVNQLAAILPSTVAAGNYNVTVTNSTGTSPGFPTQVVNLKPGIITASSDGSGLAVVQNFVSQSQLDIDRFTTFSASGFTFSPSKPGQVLIVWMTGLGALPSGTDNTASAAVDFNPSKRIRAVVGGREITPLYAGRAPGLAGADQVNFTLPADVQTGCIVPFTVTVDGQTSNSTFVAIAPTSAATECVQPGFTTAQLRSFDEGGSITYGAFSLSQIQATVPQLGTVKINSAGGSFTRLTGFQLNSASGLRVDTTSSGACTVIRVRGTAEQLGNPAGTAKGLDAGAVTLTGPAGSNLTSGVPFNKSAENSYSLSLGFEGAGIPQIPGQINATLVAGQYRIAGAGGAAVGSFNAAVNLGSPLTITGGLPTAVNRASGLPLAWSGGNASDIVQILGYSGTNSGTGTSATVDAVQFVCATTAGRGGFTVPSDVLLQLPAISAGQISGGTGTGYLAVMSSVTPATFNAPLVGGGSIENSTFSAFTGIAGFPSYQ